MYNGPESPVTESARTVYRACERVLGASHAKIVENTATAMDRLSQSPRVEALTPSAIRSVRLQPSPSPMVHAPFGAAGSSPAHASRTPQLRVGDTSEFVPDDVLFNSGDAAAGSSRPPLIGSIGPININTDGMLS